MDKQFQVGDIVVWDETSVNFEHCSPYFGLGPFQILNLSDHNGHIVIKVMDGAPPGSYGTRDFTCGEYDIRPAVFLTADYRANHGS